MSRIITTRTEIKDKALAMQAFKQAGVSCIEQGDRFLRFTSGSMRNALLDLETGTITGDSDFGHEDGLGGVLRQYYSEAQFKQEALKIGTTIDEREVNKEGEIVLLWHTA